MLTANVEHAYGHTIPLICWWFHDVKIIIRGGDSCQKVGGLMLDLACRTVCGTRSVPLSRGVWGHAPPGKFCI